MGDHYTNHFNRVERVIIGASPILSPDDPDLIDCPHGCGQLTWWNGEVCWNCGRPVLAYLERQNWLRNVRNKMKIGAIVLILTPAVYALEHVVFESMIVSLAMAIVGCVFFLSFLGRQQ